MNREKVEILKDLSELLDKERLTEEIEKIQDVSVRLSTGGTEVFSLIINIAGDEISRLR